MTSDGEDSIRSRGVVRFQDCVDRLYETIDESAAMMRSGQMLALISCVSVIIFVTHYTILYCTIQSTVAL